MALSRKRSACQRSNDVADRRQGPLGNGKDHSEAGEAPIRSVDTEFGNLSGSVPAAGNRPGSISIESTTLRIVATRKVIRFGVVVPVHNEERLVSAALDALDRAIGHVSDSGVSVGIAVVLDRCSDRSSNLVSAWRNRAVEFHEAHHIEILELQAGNVGSARRAGCQALLRQWSHAAPDEIWLATTDADSEVPGDWIAAQLRMRSEGAQVWVGGVTVCDWSDRTPGTAQAWRNQYESEALPIHGANFGIDATTYLEAGGFGSLASGEDRDLVKRALGLGAAIRHDPLVRVVTSGRRNGRAPRGFAHALTSIEVAMPVSELGQAKLTAS